MPRFANSRQAAVLTLAAILSGVCRAAWADVSVCVKTAAELQSALTDASDGGVNNGDNNYIHIAAGTYKVGAATGNDSFFYHSTASHSIDIEGGYNATCSKQTAKASLSVLDGNDLANVLLITSPNGNVFIYNLTLQNGNGLLGGGLQINHLVSVAAEIAVQNTIIRNNHSTADAGGIYASGAGGFLRMSNNVIVDNSADGQYGAGYVTAYSSANYLFNNTMVGNTASASGTPIGGFYWYCDSSCSVDSNIFWNNTTYGLYLGNGTADLAYNDYGTLGGAAPSSNVSPLSLQPKFVDEANGDFHLTSASPLLGASLNLGGYEVDPDGNGYPTSGNVDIGAYEDTVFTDDFEGG